MTYTIENETRPISEAGTYFVQYRIVGVKKIEMEFNPDNEEDNRLAEHIEKILFDDPIFREWVEKKSSEDRADRLRKAANYLDKIKRSKRY
jgi:hypothetical protein